LGDSVQPKVNGFALFPQKSPSALAAYAPTASYNEAKIKKSLRAPCKEFCQDIMLKTMEDKFKWEPDFNHKAVPRPEPVKVKGMPHPDTKQ